MTNSTETKRRKKVKDRPNLDTSNKMNSELLFVPSSGGGGGSSSGSGLVLGRELVQDGKRLVDLRVHRLRSLQQVDKLGVLHLEQHTRDLAGEFRLFADKGEEPSELFG